MLKKLENQYAELLEANNFVETEETKRLAKEYREKNHTEKCMECGGLATITCQFH